MTEIKGGIKFEKGIIPKVILDTGIKLPFEASGWKSDNKSELVPESKELKEIVITPEGPETAIVSGFLFTKEYLTKLKLAELQKIAKKFKIIGKTKNELIGKLMKIEVR